MYASTAGTRDAGGRESGNSVLAGDALLAAPITIDSIWSPNEAIGSARVFEGHGQTAADGT